MRNRLSIFIWTIVSLYFSPAKSADDAAPAWSKEENELLDQAASYQCEEKSIERARALAELAFEMHNSKNIHLASEIYEKAIDCLPNDAGDRDLELSALVNYGYTLLKTKREIQARKILELAVRKLRDPTVSASNAFLAYAWNTLGLAYLFTGERRSANQAFLKAIGLDQTLNGWEPVYNAGVASSQLGDVNSAIHFYSQVIENNPNHIEAAINLAAINHNHLNFPDAIRLYNRAMDLSDPNSSLYVMAKSNAALARMEQGRAEEALQAFQEVLQTRKSQGTDMSTLLETRAYILTTKRILCNWDKFEIEAQQLFDDVLIHQIEQQKRTSLLPFDTLLYPLSGQDRKTIAIAHSKVFESNSNPAKLRADFSSRKPRIGYMSFDFNDHPTTHLVEDLFAVHRSQKRLETHILSYGKDDSSKFRKRLESAGDFFHNIILFTHDESEHLIKTKLELDILVDMQGYTRGSREEIVARRPTPVTVNFLVFAGTSGANFIDYFIGDRISTPLAEISTQFTEKLVIMPHSYQVNSFRQVFNSGTDYFKWMAAKRLTDDRAIEAASFVFGNLNKNDKLEPITFDAWMQILLQVPGSVLLLMEASRRLSIHANLEEKIRLEATARGVAPSRILFTRHAPKDFHIARHVKIDLFLDSFIYGAHSTATDALRGGLPVLTLKGSVFGSRVAASLLHAVGMEYMVASETKEFIRTAVRIGKSPTLALALKAKLNSSLRNNAPLFDSALYGYHLETAYKSMLDLCFISESTLEPRFRTMHIIVSNTSLPRALEFKD